MNYLHRLILSAISLFAIAHAKAQQPVTISFKVLDEKGSPLPGATINLQRATDTSIIYITSTNQNGQVSIQRELPSATYRIKASAIGYAEEFSKVFMVNSGENSIALPAIKLEPITKVLNAVVVSGRKPFIEQKLGMTVVNVEGSITTTGSTVMELLEKSPGVMVDKDGNISIQGKSGVQVYIDGRPTYLSNSDLTTYLRNMQGDGISSIELITAPSAKYDAAGNAGIINIKTKRNRSLGSNGTITLGAGHGKFNKANAGLGLNYRSKAVNLFANYNYQYNKRYKKLDIDRVSVLPGERTDFIQYNYENGEFNNHALKMGADYSIKQNAVIGFLFNGSHNLEDQITDGRTTMGMGGQLDSLIKYQNYSCSGIDNYNYNLNYKQTFDSARQELSIDLDYGTFKNRKKTNYDNYFYYANGTPYKPVQYLRSNTPNIVTIKSIRADYVYNNPKWIKLEFGAKASDVNTENIMLFEENKTNNWQVDTGRTNDFYYKEQVLAAYVNGGYKFGKLSYQWGIRVEHTSSRGFSPMTNKTVSRKYIDYFPSIQLQYALPHEQTIGLTYSKRIQRPNYQTLNPFINFLDQYGYQVGNPYLNPQYMHGIEMTYVLKGKYMAQAAASRTDDMISEVLLPDSAAKAIYSTFENLNNQHSYRLTLGAPITIAKWWTSNNNMSGIYLKTTSQNLKGQNLNAGKFFVLFNTSNSFQFGKGFSAELSGRYTSTVVYSTIKLKPICTVDIGLAKTILKNKGTLKLSAIDVFNTMIQKVESVYPGFNYKLEQKVESRIIRLGFTYRFGNKNVKSARNRSTGTEEEQNRLQNKGL